MPTVRISRIDVPGARVEDETVAALLPRLGGELPAWDDNGSVLIPFIGGTEADRAVTTVERALDSTPALTGWRTRLTLSV
jgi:hypothetical protein